LIKLSKHFKTKYLGKRLVVYIKSGVFCQSLILLLR